MSGSDEHLALRHAGQETGRAGDSLPAMSPDNGFAPSAEAISAEIERLEWLEAMACYLRHEVRTALAGVRSSIHLVGTQLGPVAQCMGYLERGARNLDLIEDLLDSVSAATGIEAALMQESAGRCRIDRVIAERLADYETLIYPGLCIEGSLGGGPLWIRGRAARIIQVLDNLVDNAVRHRAPGTPVTVALRGAGEDAVLEVANCGSRLPDRPLTKPRACRRLGSPAAPGSRRGIGLYVVGTIARHYGGALGADNMADGAGVVFRVSLPLLIRE